VPTSFISEGDNTFINSGAAAFSVREPCLRVRRAADRGFALAHAGFADCCSYLYLYWDPTRANLAAADSASRKAVALDPGLAEAHASRAVALSTSRNYPDAEKEFRKPFSSVRTSLKRTISSGALTSRRGLKEAIPPVRAACKVRPEDYQAPALLAMAYAELGRRAAASRAYARALKVIKQQLSVNPGDVRALYIGAIALAHRQA
jgi:tetratricopeptide (TPR) repeat protein